MSAHRVAFLGTPEVAVATLDALHVAGVEIPIVVSGPDRRRGRGSALSASPVKARAAELGIDVSVDPDAVLASGATLGVVVAFGRLIRPHLLEAMPFVNLHFSLLPRWRGAAPLERAILAGDDRTGVCLMEVTEGLDEGGVFTRRSIEIGDKHIGELRAELVEAGNALLLAALRDGFGPAEPQQGEVTYAHKLGVDDRRIDWSGSAAAYLRVVRIGGAWTTFRGRRIKVADAVVDGNRLVPTVVQPEGKAPMDFDSWRNGVRPAPGEWFE